MVYFTKKLEGKEGKKVRDEWAVSILSRTNKQTQTKKIFSLMWRTLSCSMGCWEEGNSLKGVRDHGMWGISFGREQWPRCTSSCCWPSTGCCQDLKPVVGVSSDSLNWSSWSQSGFYPNTTSHSVLIIPAMTFLNWQWYHRGLQRSKHVCTHKISDLILCHVISGHVKSYSDVQCI